MTATTTPDYRQPVDDWHRPLADATFHAARTVDEAVSLAAEHDDARYIAGGTALVRLGRWGGCIGPALVYLGGIDELKAITPTDSGYEIGSLVVNGRLITDTQLGSGASVLGQSARWIAGTAVRNLGTVGGNVAIDGSLGPALVALGAEVVVRTADNEQTIDLATFVDEALAGDGALITGVRIRTDLPAQSYQAMLGASAAAALRLDGELCAEARIGVGGLDIATRRLTEAEELLVGEAITDELVTQVGEIAYRSASDGQTSGGDFDYLSEMARVMTERAVDEAAGRPSR
jgi:aerobic carbon-monoxide dehydrogenase medium subunit